MGSIAGTLGFGLSSQGESDVSTEPGLSPAALIIAVLALVVATSAGTAYAATKIGTKQLKNNAVTSAKIKNKTIATSDLATRTTRSLRGASGPQGPVGPRGPGTLTFDRSVAATGFGDDVRLPQATLTLYCSPTQVFTQVNRTGSSSLMVAGTYGVNDNPPTSVSSSGTTSVAFNQASSKMWLNLQISNAAAGATTTLRVHAVRENGTCRWIGQYIG